MGEIFPLRILHLFNNDHVLYHLKVFHQDYSFHSSVYKILGRGGVFITIF